LTISDISDVYACKGEVNYMNYCNKKFSVIAETLKVTLSADKRAALANEAEIKYLVPDVPSIPMFARPLYVIRAASLKGPVVNPTTEGSPWNVGTWAQ